MFTVLPLWREQLKTCPGEDLEFFIGRGGGVVEPFHNNSNNLFFLKLSFFLKFANSRDWGGGPPPDPLSPSAHVCPSTLLSVTVYW